ncbi:MAG: hypothetical protein ACPGQL_02600 [Thermoplasmatota archaeon]
MPIRNTLLASLAAIALLAATTPVDAHDQVQEFTCLLGYEHNHGLTSHDHHDLGTCYLAFNIEALQVEYWEETNGLEGLQKHATMVDGVHYDADNFVGDNVGGTGGPLENPSGSGHGGHEH